MKRLLTFSTILAVTGLLFHAQVATAQIAWGGPGNVDSEFAGGLNGWTSTGVTCPDAKWIWEADGKADMGAYSGMAAALAIQSPSVANGAMVFDSDFYDNAGVQGNFGLGICPSPHVGELISPLMDLSAYSSDRLSLKFNQYHRNFDSFTQVAWSMDGGNSWSDPITVNTIATNTATPRNDVKTIPLKKAFGSPQFRVKFIFDADYYFWIVDDVQIVLREKHNMQVNTNFFAIAPNFRTPKSQVEEFGFLSDIENVGGKDQTNVNLNIKIKNDANQSVVYNDDWFYGTVPSDSTVENVSFGAFTPDASAAKYTSTYLITADSTDSNLANNTIQWKFEVTDSIFSKERQKTRDVQPAPGNWDAGELHTWAYGNYFYVPAGDGFRATSCSFGISNAADLTGEQLFLKLYQWFDIDENGNAEPDERFIVGINVYDVVGNESATVPKKIPLFDIGFDHAPDLEDDAHYIMMVEFTPSAAGKDFLTHASEEFDYGAMVLNSEQISKPRYAAMLGINDPLDDEAYSSGGFGRDIVPVVRLHINEKPNAANELSADNMINVFPNPASSLLNVDLELVKTSSKFRMTILDVNGKLVSKKDYQNIRNDKLQIDISNYATGTYLMFISTDAGTATRKFVVQH